MQIAAERIVLCQHKKEKEGERERETRCSTAGKRVCCDCAAVAGKNRGKSHLPTLRQSLWRISADYSRPKRSERQQRSRLVKVVAGSWANLFADSRAVQLVSVPYCAHPRPAEGVLLTVILVRVLRLHWNSLGTKVRVRKGQKVKVKRQ